MQALTVDFTLITQSMRDLSREQNEYYLDKTTGKVISLSRDLIRALTREAFEERLTLPAWDAQMIPVARKIVLSGKPEFVRIPEAFGRPEHHWRCEFSETVDSDKLKQKLKLALRGRGSCKRFKEILMEHPQEKERWEIFHCQCWKNAISKWLEEVGILAFEGKPRRTPAAS